MKPIQWLISPIILFLLGLFIARLKRRPLLRLLVIGVLLCSLLMLWFPDQSTLIANYLGIGRGVDLIIYLSLLGLTVSCILLYLQILQLQQQLQTLVQAQALSSQTLYPQKLDNLNENQP